LVSSGRPHELRLQANRHVGSHAVPALVTTRTKVDSRQPLPREHPVRDSTTYRKIWLHASGMTTHFVPHIRKGRRRQVDPLCLSHMRVRFHIAFDSRVHANMYDSQISSECCLCACHRASERGYREILRRTTKLWLIRLHPEILHSRCSHRTRAACYEDSKNAANAQTGAQVSRR
jgi:hypothetical protein